MGCRLKREKFKNIKCETEWNFGIHFPKNNCHNSLSTIPNFSYNAGGFISLRFDDEYLGIISESTGFRFHHHHRITLKHKNQWSRSTIEKYQSFFSPFCEILIHRTSSLLYNLYEAIDTQDRNTARRNHCDSSNVLYKKLVNCSCPTKYLRPEKGENVQLKKNRPTIRFS